MSAPATPEPDATDLDRPQRHSRAARDATTSACAAVEESFNKSAIHVPVTRP